MITHGELYNFLPAGMRFALKSYRNLISVFTDHFHSKKIYMGNLLYIVAVILIIGWLLGFFVFHAGGIIHLLLVIAVIVIIVKAIQGRNVL